MCTSKTAYKLVLLRHGESIWNRENRFTGWVDVDLTDRGISQAAQAGRLLKQAGYRFDLAYTSVLKRAIRTLWQVQDSMGLMHIPVLPSWRLNERHYGALTGLNKAELAQKYGDEQVLIWRRSYVVRPPVLSEPESRRLYDHERYRDLVPQPLPLTENLQDTFERVLPIWEGEIAPAVRAGKKVLVVAHGNSLRALVKYLDNLDDLDIVGLSIPNGIPLIYELDEHLKPISRQYLRPSALSAQSVEEQHGLRDE